MRISLFAAAATAALALVGSLASDSIAEHPQLAYPATYDVSSRIYSIATITGAGIDHRMTRRDTAQDVVVFDDESNVHFEPNAGAPELHAAWWWTRHRRASFQLDAEAAAWIEQSIEDEAGLDVTVRVRRGRLTFRRDHESFTGLQVIRATAYYRGARITVRERIRYVGTPRPPVDTMADAGATHAFAAVADRMRTAVGSLPGR